MREAYPMQSEPLTQNTAQSAAVPFNFGSHQVRVVTIEGEPWFVAADLCLCLSSYIRTNGSVNTGAALSKLDPNERGTLSYLEAKRIGLQHIASRAYGVSIVSESGLYTMVMRSDKPEARTFQDWVTREVLPSIRKTGAFVTGQPSLVENPKMDPLDLLMAHRQGHRNALQRGTRGEPVPIPSGAICGARRGRNGLLFYDRFESIFPWGSKG